MNAKQHQINLAYDSWQHLLYKKVDDFEYFLDAVKADLSAVGMSKKDSTLFMDEKIAEMRVEIAARKEDIRAKRRAM